MGHSGIFIDYRIFYFHKIADLYPGFQMAVGPHVGKGADFDSFVQPGLLDLAGVDAASVAHKAVLDHRIRADDAVFPNDCFSF